MPISEKHWELVVQYLAVKAQDLGINDPNQQMQLFKSEWDTLHDEVILQDFVDAKELESLKQRQEQMSDIDARVVELEAKLVPIKVVEKP